MGLVNFQNISQDPAGQPLVNELGWLNPSMVNRQKAWFSSNFPTSLSGKFFEWQATHWDWTYFKMSETWPELRSIGTAHILWCLKFWTTSREIDFSQYFWSHFQKCHTTLVEYLTLVSCMGDINPYNSEQMFIRSQVGLESSPKPIAGLPVRHPRIGLA